MARTFDDMSAPPARSAVCWSSIVAGAFAALGVSLILLALGSGLGFAFVSPWPGRGMSATALTATAAIWLLVTQWVSAGIGGYIAGRLRTRWLGTHVHEVFFRDTAHGLITWAVTTVVVVALTLPWAGTVSWETTHVTASVTASAVDTDLARKAAAETAIYLALSLLVGAFVASVAAAVGGRQRDLHV